MEQKITFIKPKCNQFKINNLIYKDLNLLIISK